MRVPETAEPNRLMAMNTGSIRERGGRWQIRWREDGRDKAETYATKDEAELALARHQVEAKETKLGLRGDAHSFDEMAAEWLKTRGAHKRSRKTDETLIRVHLAPELGGLPLEAIDYQRIERLKASRLARGLSKNSVDHVLTLLGSMLRHAKALGWLACDLPPIKKYRPKAPPYRWLRTEEEILRFLRAARDESSLAFAVYAFAIKTGARKGEICALRWGDVDFDRRLVHIARSHDSQTTKNGGSRFVPIDDETCMVLRDWKLQNRGEIVFQNRSGGQLEPKHRVFEETMRRVLASAEFPPRYLSFHGLRHTYASHLVHRGADLYRVQALLGHNDPTVTQIYAHLRPDVFEADRERLAGLIPGAGSASVTEMSARRRA